MGIGSSIALIAIGLILWLAVDVRLAGIDIQVIGIILVIAGVLGLILTLVLSGQRRDPLRNGTEREVVRERHRDY